MNVSNYLVQKQIIVGVMLEPKGLSQETLIIIIITRPQSLYFFWLCWVCIANVQAVHCGMRHSLVAFSLCCVSLVAPCMWDLGSLIRDQICIPALKVVFSATGPPGKDLP